MIRVRFIILLIGSVSLFAQAPKTPAGDWPMFNRDLAGTRYSPLTQIKSTNVAKLKPVWSYRLQPAAFRFATASGMSELTPLVVKGVMYVSTQTQVVALEPETGKEIWRYETPWPISALGRYLLEPAWLRAYRDVPVVTVSESSRESLAEYGLRRVTVVPEGWAARSWPDPAEKETVRLSFSSEG